MRRNRFEQVDEVQDDAITFEVAPDGASEVAKVHVPAAISKGKFPKDNVTHPMPKVDAFRGAIQLANEIKAPMVVLDPHSAWDPEWGDLFRPA